MRNRTRQFCAPAGRRPATHPAPESGAARGLRCPRDSDIVAAPLQRPRHMQRVAVAVIQLSPSSSKWRRARPRLPGDGEVKPPRRRMMRLNIRCFTRQRQPSAATDKHRRAAKGRIKPSRSIRRMALPRVKINPERRPARQILRSCSARPASPPVRTAHPAPASSHPDPDSRPDRRENHRTAGRMIGSLVAMRLKTQRIHHRAKTPCADEALRARRRQHVRIEQRRRRRVPVGATSGFQEFITARGCSTIISIHRHSNSHPGAAR